MPKFLTLLVLLFCLQAQAQKRYGLEQDLYMYRQASSSLVPTLYGQTEKNWYGALRFNYEDDQTLSAQVGKVFSKEGTLSYSVTPMVGLLGGQFNGISGGAQIELTKGDFSFYNEPLYCRSFAGKSESFFYNWTEASWQPLKKFYGGVAMQQTKTAQSSWLLEPGFVAGFSSGRFDVPLYWFSSGAGTGYFVLGVHWSIEKR